MPTDEERQAYIDKWAAGLGDDVPTPSAVRLHKLMAKHDLGVEIGFTDLRDQIKEGPLDAKTVELLYIIGYTIRGFDQKHLVWHTKAALRAGATPEEILHAIEILIFIDGIIPFMRALEAWADVTGAEGIEPSS
jgi:4-carboxymuconolactone decarboxylase